MALCVSEALVQARRQLQASATPELDAELLLAQVLERGRAYLRTWPERLLSPPQQASFEQLVERRARGEPVAYLLGRRGFWNLDLQVNAQVLIPRAETELLVELALHLLPAGPAQVADLGTGSGAIALALAQERPHWQLLATDISAAALALARDNARAAGLGNVRFRQGAWCAALGDDKVDAIISNPPYIDEQDVHLQQGDLRFEPRAALVAADQGLADLRCIAQQAPARLRAGGWLLLEHGWQQGAAVRAMLAQLDYQQIQTHQDLAGNDRVTTARPGRLA